MRTIPSAFRRSGLSRRDDPDVPAPFREDDDKRPGSGEADCGIAVFGFMDFMARKDRVFKDLRGFFEADTVLTPVAFCFLIVSLKPIEFESKHFPVTVHMQPPRVFVYIQL